MTGRVRDSGMPCPNSSLAIQLSVGVGVGVDVLAGSSETFVPACSLVQRRRIDYIGRRGWPCSRQRWKLHKDRTALQDVVGDDSVDGELAS